MRIVSETEFRERLVKVLTPLLSGDFGFVTGPGRSGAIAAVYASHFLGIPYVPFKCSIPDKTALIVDTAILTGKTLRKASRDYDGAVTIALFDESCGERVKFWYEELSLDRGKGNEYVP